MPLPKWLTHLSHDDLDFLKRFVLASGSLKALAEDYGISYPTVRLRLDRLMTKIKLVEEVGTETELERSLQDLYAEGSITLDTLKTLRKAQQRDHARRGLHPKAVDV